MTADGVTQETRYDALGNPVETGYHDGKAYNPLMRVSFDGTGRQVWAVSLLGTLLYSRYNTEGQLLESGHANRRMAQVRHYAYDSYGRLAEARYPLRVELHEIQARRTGYWTQRPIPLRHHRIRWPECGPAECGMLARALEVVDAKFVTVFFQLKLDTALRVVLRSQRNSSQGRGRFRCGLHQALLADSRRTGAAALNDIEPETDLSFCHALHVGHQQGLPHICLRIQPYVQTCVRDHSVLLEFLEPKRRAKIRPPGSYLVLPVLEKLSAAKWPHDSYCRIG